jgi:serine/threonine protein kinase
MKFQHPNIATLLAYSFPTNLRGNYYLIYEFAERGALDEFWKDETGRIREQLSLKQRTIIAYQVFTGLQFLHKGDNTINSCCHRDLKSANIVLDKFLTAKLIDCGIATFITDDNTKRSLTGIKGTSGYICPDYASVGFGYDTRCDIFSFGVVLTELLTGKLQNYVTCSNKPFKFTREYITKKNRRNLADDIDPVLNVTDPGYRPKFVDELCDLALMCMEQDRDDRPTGDEVMKALAFILSTCINDKQNPINFPVTPCTNTACCKYCRTYQIYPGSEICHFCLIVNNQKFIIGNQSVMNAKIDKVLIKLDAITPILTALDAKFNNPIPRLFILYPATKNKIWKHPKSWLNSKIKDKYQLQFVCAYSFTVIDPPLKVTITKDWVARVAPVLAVSLHLMNLALKTVANIKLDVLDAANELFQINKNDLEDMRKEVWKVLDEKERIQLQASLEADSSIEALSSTAYDKIYELAETHVKWKDNMKQVKTKDSAETIWVAKHIEINE